MHGAPRLGDNDHTFQAYWQTKVDGLYFDKQKIAFSTDVIIDSGTAMILGDSATVKALYDKITGSAPIGSGQYKSTGIGQLSLAHRRVN